MEERIRNLEDFSQIATQLAIEMDASLRRVEESQRRTEESLRRMEESQRQMEESQQRRDEILQQLLQAVAVIQADIVRIDETHSQRE